MNQSELKDQILHILSESRIGTMATVSRSKPHSRYMTFFNDGLTLYTVTSRETHKAEELDQNPYTHILIGYDGKGFGDTYAEIEGKVSQSDSDEWRQKVWNDSLEPWFTGPDDPDLLVLKVSPLHIRLMNKKGEAPKTLELV